MKISVVCILFLFTFSARSEIYEIRRSYRNLYSDRITQADRYHIFQNFFQVNLTTDTRKNKNSADHHQSNSAIKH